MANRGRDCMVVGCMQMYARSAIFQLYHSDQF